MIQTPATVTRSAAPSDVELAATVRNFHAARVLVVGDIILDRYITGAVQRLSPEAPIPVLRPAGATLVACHAVEEGRLAAAG